MKAKQFRKPLILSIAALALAFGLSFGTPLLAADNSSQLQQLPVSQIEDIIGITGDIKNGVLDLGIERKDIGNVQGPPDTATPVTFTPAFQINGDIFFQPLGGQNVTSTPLPQAPPPNPTTPLDVKRLENILHGHASVGDEGVVTVWVYRANRVTIQGVNVNPQTNISTNIEFKPLNDAGSQAAVVPDFSMEANEIWTVVKQMMIKKNWFQGCLYNQETNEQPQLYFDHMIKVGDPYILAAEIRQGLNLTDSE